MPTGSDESGVAGNTRKKKVCPKEKIRGEGEEQEVPERVVRKYKMRCLNELGNLLPKNRPALTRTTDFPPPVSGSRGPGDGPAIAYHPGLDSLLTGTYCR